MQLYNFIKI